MTRTSALAAVLASVLLATGAFRPAVPSPSVSWADDTDPPQEDPPVDPPADPPVEPPVDPPAPDAPKPPADPPKADKPKPPDNDPSVLSDKEKAAKLSEAKKTYDDNARNGDLIPVRTRRAAVKFAGDLRFPPAGDFLKHVFVKDNDLTTRVAAFMAIGRCGDTETIQSAVKTALASTKKEPIFALSLPKMIESVTNDEVKEWLTSRLEQRDDEVIAAVVEAIGVAKVASAEPALAELLAKSKDVAVRFEVLRALARLGGKGAQARVLPFLADADWHLRMGAAEALGFTGSPEFIPDLTKLIVRTEEPIVAETAVEAIARIGTKDAIDPLIASLKVGRLRARQKARVALTGLAKSLYKQEKDFSVDPMAWSVWWGKVQRGVDPDDPTFKGSDTTSYFNVPIHSDRVLFILDVSGSMNWPDAPRDSGIRPADWRERRIDVAHKEMFKALRDLAKSNQGRAPKKLKKGETSDSPDQVSEDGTEPPTMFSVATFAGVVTPWQKQALVASSENVELAIAWLEKQLPRGGTATYDALEFGIAQDNIDTIFFLSDGVPSLGKYEERETILAEVRKLNRFKRVTIHTIALIIGLSPIESARKYEDPDDMADIMSRIAGENQGGFVNRSKL
ncbi:MAG: HEAT repeat domain-containing protein [Planctomycetes bacterium]|nr:HEAT repeat domain-containing protein [Planctomycetota bacterium]